MDNTVQKGNQPRYDVCIYHKADMDGICAGAIVKNVYPDCNMIGMDYCDAFDEYGIENVNRIFMVDFSLPKHQMECLNRKVNLIWCDHHISALEQKWAADFKPDGIRDVNRSGCRLIWDYLQEQGAIPADKKCPYGIQQIEKYDLGKIDTDVLCFDYGLRPMSSNPCDTVWTKIIQDMEFIGPNILKAGLIIVGYERAQIKRGMDRAFPVYFEGYKAIALNWPNHPGLVYKEEILKLDYDLFITYRDVSATKKSVTISTENPDIHCGELCQRHGGGGHKGIGGIVCERLPFSNMPG